jgi:glutathione-regulated potassium-efflux system ancillary protein KefG
MAKRILVLFAHPALRKSRINRRLVGAIQGLDGVTIHDLYEAYPDFAVDVRFEQRLLLEHDIIVLQHPFYWYSTPAILKEWEDLVLEYGFAYGHLGDKLKGKWVLSAITAGGPESAYQRGGYNHFTIRELLAPIEQTARLCGMIYLPPFVVPGAIFLTSDDQIKGYAREYRTTLEWLRDGILDLSSLEGLEKINERIKAAVAGDRPDAWSLERR